MTVAPGVGFDPFAEGFTDDPYPHYAQLRTHRPVEQHVMGFWALWRYDEVAAMLRGRHSVEDRNAGPSPIRDLMVAAYGDTGRRAGGLSMLDRDPPDHTRLRRLVSAAFTPRTVEGLTPLVERLVEESLDRLAEAAQGNLIDLVAFPLPFAVISEMLGMPEMETGRLRTLSHHMVRSLEPVNDIDELHRIQDATFEMQDITREVIAWKREHPADDLLTALIHAEDDGDVLSDDELVAQVILLYVAGHETTVNLIGNGALALLRHPDQADKLRSNPQLDENAVEECLRYDSPVQMSRRITLAPYVIGDRTMPPGTFVISSLASANRDQRVFGEDADTLRVDREDARRHVSFGAGVHHCLGATLARLEGRVALGRLVRRFPQLSLAGTPTWNGRINLRGLTDLPVSVG